MSVAQFLAWFATGTGIVAAIIVSLNLGATKTGWGFVVFTVSSLAWIASALLQGETPLTIQNCVLLVINVVGIYRYLLADSSKPQAAGSGGVTRTG